MDIYLILFLSSIAVIGYLIYLQNITSNKLTKFMTLEENKIDLDNEEYPFNQTLKGLLSQIETVEEGYTEYIKTKEGIDTKLEDLKLLTSRLNLTLSSNQKRGNWGEIQAEKILEDAGLVKGQHFETQKILPSGKKPDVTFNLPNNKILNLDVKFPLENYMRYLDILEKRNNSIDQNEVALLDKSSFDMKNQFLEDVRTRVKEVTKDGYIDPSSNTIDYALMFVPVEGVFQFIVENELELQSKNVDIHQEAIDNKIILVPPTLLLVYLSTIRSAVDTFNLQNKAKDLIDLHKKFIKQWKNYGDKVEQVGTSIASLQKKYTELKETRTSELNKVVLEMDQLKLEGPDSE